MISKLLSSFKHSNSGKKQRNLPFIGWREKQNQTLPNMPAVQNVTYKYKEEP